MSTTTQTLLRHRTGGWLPKEHALVKGFVDKLIARSPSLSEEKYDPVVLSFKIFIDNDPIVRLLATEMFNEVPVTPPYNKDPTLKSQIRTYDQMFDCINTILTEGPQWYTSDDVDAMGLIGFPINAILDWPMGTRSGYDFFTRADVNAHWQAVLKKWQIFLSSPASVQCLDPSTGWTSSSALTILADKGNDGTDNYTFQQMYQCDPTKQYLGFINWDDFFTRKFREGIRPVAYPDGVSPTLPGGPDPLFVIVNACESTPCNRQENVKLRDMFWAKSQPYSLSEMLNGDDNAKPFVGGQVYQAFLSALSYHRWHAPISGVVMSVENLNGTYYSENFYEGFANVVNGVPKPDPNAPNNSQPYIAEVAARGIIHIKSDNPKIGHMAMVFIGMCEVSSNDFFVKKGDRLTKGQEIGTFHFGGSTHCLIFGPGVNIKFEDPGPYTTEENNKKVNSALAVVI